MIVGDFVAVHAVQVSGESPWIIVLEDISF